MLAQTEILNTTKTVSINDFFILFKRASNVTILTVCIFQIILWPSLSNIFGILVSLFSWWLINIYILKLDIWFKYPLSTFIVLGFSLQQHYFPALFMLLEGKPIIFNMKVPFDVFQHSFLSIIIVILSHTFYTSINTHRYRVSTLQKFLISKKIFNTPTNSQIWLIGCIGLLSMYYVYFYSPSVGNEVSGAGNKFIQGLIPFSYAPFYLLIRPMFGARATISKSTYLGLLLFIILLFIVSIGRNSRGAFMMGFVGLAFCYFEGLLLGVFSSKILTLRNLIIGLLTFWLLTGPLSDLGTAMLIVRSQRSNISRSELLIRTIDVYQQKEKLRLYKQGLQRSAPVNFGWDEYYLDNIFLARFCNLKFNDASLELSNNIGHIDPVIQEYAINRLISIFPTPILNIFGFNVKESISSYSPGDLLYSRGGGGHSLGGFRVSHFSGFGMASLGWWYLALLFLLLIPSFFIWDSLVIKLPKITGERQQVLFSFAALISANSVFQFISIENVLTIAQFLIRGWLQLLFLYWTLFSFTRFLTQIFRK